MKKRQLTLLFLILVLVVCFSVLQPLQVLNGIEEGFLVAEEDVESANENNVFGGFIKTQLLESDRSVGGEKVKKTEVVFKLFGFIPIKKIDVELIQDEEYFVGGVPIGISICSDGAIVISGGESGKMSFKEGDIITEIEGKKVNDLEEVSRFLQEVEAEDVEVKFVRKNKEFKTLTNVLKDETGKKKLGLWVKDDVSGVGTLTFVNKDTKEYGALGHPIVESAGGNVVPVANGQIFECNLIGIEKGKRNNPGELKCVFVSSKNSKGSVERNNKFGIKGVLSDVSNLVDENKTAKLGGRLGVKMGAAKIVSSISGIREEYDIEIIKANYQKNADDKSIVFRVKDKRLLELTGGIVQGMSGSPILQDGKIIGAVTHVFMSDPTKGYGVYTDFML